MAEPFKNFFNPKMIALMAEYLQDSATGNGFDFDRSAFIEFCARDMDELELKQRSARIVQGLKKYLPADFLLAGKILVDSLDPIDDAATGPGSVKKGGIRGWAIMPMADYVGEAGIDHVHEALETLKELTCRWSSEFGIRAFFRDHPEQTLKKVSGWLNDDNEHVRRLISEGSRPRLPWGERLNNFIDEPEPVIGLLEHLKDDESEYVRRSVANNLNDISKDHPDLVVRIAQNWLQDASADRKRLVRHALRSLIKNGHKGALGALGYDRAEIEITSFEIPTPRVTLGEALEFELGLVSKIAYEQALIIDYILHHQKAGGKTSAKVFKWKKLRLAPGQELHIKKRHAIRPVTTRKYYEGRHRLEIFINGEVVCGADFELKLA